MEAHAEYLIDRIEAVFERMPPGTMTLEEAAHSKDVPIEESPRRKSTSKPRRWQELADEEIEENGKAFYGADVDSWLSFVPAWMRWSLRHYRTSDSFVGDQIIYTLDPRQQRSRFGRFSADQSCVIYEYLCFMSQNDVWADADVAQRAIDEYWRCFAP